MNVDVDTAASSATTLGVPPSAPRSSSNPTPAPADAAAVAPGSGTAGWIPPPSPDNLLDDAVALLILDEAVRCHGSNGSDLWWPT